MSINDRIHKDCYLCVFNKLDVYIKNNMSMKTALLNIICKLNNKKVQSKTKN